MMGLADALEFFHSHLSWIAPPAICSLLPEQGGKPEIADASAGVSLSQKVAARPHLCDDLQRHVRLVKLKGMQNLMGVLADLVL